MIGPAGFGAGPRLPDEPDVPETSFFEKRVNELYEKYHTPGCGPEWLVKIAEDLQADLGPVQPGCIHTTVGVYPDSSWKQNGVMSEFLAQHIAYNLSFRPGRALFIDGECIYTGNVSAERLERARLEIAARPRVTVDTKPYN